MIFQLIDDHSRYALASLVAPGETVDAAITVVKERAITDPRRPSTAAHRQRPGVEPVTAWGGRPTRPPTSPDWVSRRSPASLTSRPPRARTNGSTRPCSGSSTSNPWPHSLAELQAQVDAFDLIYNTERPHQSLPGRITPLQAWTATAQGRATPPQHPTGLARPARSSPTQATASEATGGPPCRHPTQKGQLGRHHQRRQGHLQIDVDHALKQVLVVNDADTIIISDFNGEILAGHTRPAPGITCVGNGRPRGPRPRNPGVSPMS